MSPDRDDPIDALAERLADWDQALASGHDPVTGNITDAEQNDVNFLKLLRTRWPGHTSHATNQIANDDTHTAQAPAGKTHPARKLGRFEILHEIGRGGFGVVFLAYDPKLERRVALKVPNTFAVEDPGLRRRFQQEARAAAGLDHPHIVPVYDAGDEGPICFITSAYCPGTNLAEWLRHRRDGVSFVDAAEVVEKLAAAVAHAHGRSVIHRDLKPANVLLSVEQPDAPPAGEASTTRSAAATYAELPALVPRVTDFGLARIVESQEPVTRTGAMLGTPAYMAPEQAGAKAALVGPAADVYSLGGILYELISGRPPFQGDTPAEILVQLQVSDPLSPSRLRPRTPCDLETICLKCLQKEPHRRYSSAQDLADDLRRFIDHRPIVARPVGRAARAARWSRRNPLAAGLAVSLILTFLVGFTVVTRLWLSADEQRVFAETNAREAQTNASEAKRQEQRARESYVLAREALTDLVAKISRDPRMQTGQLEDMRRVVQQDQAAFYRKFVQLQGDDPEFQNERAWALFQLGILTAELGNPPDAMKSLEMAEQMFSELVAASPTDPRLLDRLCQCRMNLAAELLSSGHLDEAEKRLQANVADLTDLIEREPDDTQHVINLAGSHMNLAIVNHYRLKQLPASEPTDRRDQLQTVIDRHHHENIDVLKRLEMLDPRSAQFPLGAAHANLATELVSRGEDSRVRELLELAIGYLTSVPAESDNADDARHVLSISYNQLANLFRTMGLNDERGDALRNALEINEQLSRDHPLAGGYSKTLGNLQHNYANWLVENHDDESSVEWNLQAINTLSALVERDGDDVEVRDFLRNAHQTQATVLVRLDRNAEAVGHWQSAAEFDSGNFRSWYRLQQARSLARTDRFDEARAIVQEQITSARPTVQSRFDCANVLAIVADRSEDEQQRDALCDLAIQFLRRAVKNGFNDTKQLEHADLDILRDRADFREMIKLLSPRL